jgi:hypothetical protein
MPTRTSLMGCIFVKIFLFRCSLNTTGASLGWRIYISKMRQILRLDKILPLPSNLDKTSPGLFTWVRIELWGSCEVKGQVPPSHGSLIFLT